MSLQGRIMELRIPGHLLIRGRQFKIHNHITIDLKKIKLLENRKWWILRRPLRLLTHMPGQHQGSVLSVTNQTTDLATIPLRG